MVSREHKRSVILREKLQLLRSITNSQAVNNSSIILDASKYIQELKQKVEKLNQDISYTRSIDEENAIPIVKVKTLENKGFLINVFCAKRCPGLLVSLLEAFDDLGLNVHEARVSCADTFCLETVGGENQVEYIDAQMVKQAVLQAIKNCRENDDEEGGGGGGEEEEEDGEEEDD